MRRPGTLLILLLSIVSTHAFGASTSDPEAWEFTDGSITVLAADEDGEPVGGAEVACVKVSFDAPGRPPSASERAVTDAGGTCTFPELSGGRYYLHATAGKIGAWSETVVKPEDRHVTHTMHLGVYRSIRGTVKDSAGNPIAGVKVFVSRLLPAATTDENGVFRVRNATGQLRLFFGKDGYGWMEFGPTPSTAYFEITLPEGGSIEARVLDGDGEPAVGASVSYASAHPQYGRQYIGSGATDSEGKLVTTWLPADREITLAALYESEGYRWRAERTLEIEPGVTTPVTLQLERYAEIVVPEGTDDSRAKRPAARLLKEPETTSVSGRVAMAESGEPVRGGIVYSTNREWARGIKAMTREDGAFTVGNLPLRKHYFTVYPEKPTLYHVGGLIEIDLTDGKPVENLVLEVAEGCAIRGRILSADGQPVPREQVLFQPANPGHYRVFFSNENGRFHLSHLAFPNTEYKLEVRHDRAKTAFATVQPVGEGQVSDPVTVRFEDLYLGTPQGGTIRGVVVDTTGAPVPDVRISLASQHTEEPAITDDEGTFRLPFHKGGAAQLQAVVHSTVQIDGGIDYAERECTIVEGGNLRLEQGTDVNDARVVVEVAPLGFVAGRVTDETGAALEADIDIWDTKWTTTGVRAREGRFVLARLHEGPVLLGFTKKGYRPVLLESGPQFNIGDCNVEVVMKKGPFPKGESVFAAVTDRKDTDEEIAHMFKGDSIRRWVAMHTRDPGYVELREQPRLKLYVTDAAGSPLNRIYVEQARAVDYSPTISSTNAVPDAHIPKQALTGKNGRFTIDQRNVFISAEGTARLLLADRSGAEMVPTHVMLYPASKIVVSVVDRDGKPVEGATVSTAEDGWPHSNINEYYLPKTNALGVAEFDKLAPGYHGYNVRKDESGPEFVAIDVAPGKTYERKVVIGPPKDGTVEALVYKWQTSYDPGELTKDDLADVARTTRRDLAKFIAKELDELPGRYAWENRDTALLAKAAQVFELKSTVPAIQRLLERYTVTTRHVVRDQATAALTRALADLAGDETVGFLAALAINPDAVYEVRKEALITLGYIGTETSVAAFVKLRDAAFGKPGAPKRRDSYTHAEKMAETVEMVFRIIPDYVPPKHTTDLGGLVPKDAWVSEDYTTGHIVFGHWRVHMKRFGSEWLIVWLEGLPVP